MAVLILSPREGIGISYLRNRALCKVYLVGRRSGLVPGRPRLLVISGECPFCLGKSRRSSWSHMLGRG